MRDIGLVKNSEPTERLFTQGMVIKNGAKMSKSLGNVVSPDDMVAKYGADSTRMYTLFAAPPDRDLDWQDAGVEGVSRFLSRVYRLVAKQSAIGGTAADRSSWEQRLMMSGATGIERHLQRKLHQTVRRVTDDFQGRWHFNTSIAAIMELVNELYLALEGEFFAKDVAGVDRVVARIVPEGGASLPRIDADFLHGVFAYLALMLAPFAPYVAAELWETLGQKSNLLRESWPKFDPSLAKEDQVEMAVQVNGKIRARITVPADADEEAIKAVALADEKVKAAIAGKEIMKVLVVKGRLVNIVVK